MKQLVLISGGFHPFHPGHLSLYQAAKETFPGADVVVAATNDTSSRPFPFKIKQKLAQVSGVPPRDFVEVSRQFNAMEPAISRRIKNPNDTVLIFVRSDKDQNKPPLPAALDPATGQLPLAKRGPNKGQPVSDYLQYLAGNEDNIQPMTQHAYMAYLPTEEFGSGMTSASEIRAEWPGLDQQGKIDRVKSLYPLTQNNPALANNIVGMLDTAMGTEITEVLDTKASNATSQWDMSDPDMVKFNFTASNGVQYQLDFLAPYIGPVDPNQPKSMLRQKVDPTYNVSEDEQFNNELWKPGLDFKQDINGILYHVTNAGKKNDFLSIKAYDKKNPNPIGDAQFAKARNLYTGEVQGVTSMKTRVDPKYQGQGIAANMYALIRMLGVNVLPSETQTTAGQKMWSKWRKQGDVNSLKDLDPKVKGVAEEYNTMQFAAEKTPAINPYGGQFGIYNKRAVKTAMGENQGWAATYEATSAQNFVGGMTASYQARENQPVSEDYVLEKTSV